MLKQYLVCSVEDNTASQTFGIVCICRENYQKTGDRSVSKETGSETAGYAHSGSVRRDGRIKWRLFRGGRDSQKRTDAGH